VWAVSMCVCACAQEFKVAVKGMTDEAEATALRSGAAELLWRMTRRQIDSTVRVQSLHRLVPYCNALAPRQLCAGLVARPTSVAASASSVALPCRTLPPSPPRTPRSYAGAPVHQWEPGRVHVPPHQGHGGAAGCACPAFVTSLLLLQ
jgi:hypothetical protein